MDMDTLKPLLALMLRHGLTTLGGAMVAGGVIDKGEVSGFVGAGMVLAGIAWSWWQKRGQAEMAAKLKTLTTPKAVPADPNVRAAK